MRDDRPVQKVVPMLSYEDPAAAIDFLSRAFGFHERTRLRQPDLSSGLCAAARSGYSGRVFVDPLRSREPLCPTAKS